MSRRCKICGIRRAILRHVLYLSTNTRSGILLAVFQVCKFFSGQKKPNATQGRKGDANNAEGQVNEN